MSVLRADAVGVSDDLAEYGRSRDPQLRDALTVRHLPLVKFVARKMSANLPSYVELDDLVSWGSLGLLDAIEKFDAGRGFQFSTYAVTRIRGAILDGLQQMEWAPKQVTSKVRAISRAEQDLAVTLGRDATAEETAEKMGCTVTDVTAWRRDRAALRVKSLDGVAGGDDGTHGPEDRWLSEDAEQEVAGEVAEIRRRVTAAVGSLGAREQQVFLLYYRDSLTLREIAAELGVSVSSATQTHTRLVEQVRERLAAFGAVA